MTWKIINTLQEKQGATKESFRTSSINRTVSKIYTTQKHKKQPIIEKKRNKTKILTRNSTRLNFVKKTSMPIPVKA